MLGIRYIRAGNNSQIEIQFYQESGQEMSFKALFFCKPSAVPYLHLTYSTVQLAKYFFVGSQLHGMLRLIDILWFQPCATHYSSDDSPAERSLYTDSQLHHWGGIVHVPDEALKTTFFLLPKSSIFSRSVLNNDTSNEHQTTSNPTKEPQTSVLSSIVFV